jgi:tetratricopeptide (TPR) repeat protein
MPQTKTQMRKFIIWGTIFSMVLVIGALAWATWATDAEEHFRRAMAYQTQEKLEEAILELRAAQKKDGSFLRAKHALGQLYIDQEKFHLALGEYASVLREQPTNAEAHRKIAQIYLTQKEFQKAKESLALAEKSEPQNAELFTLQAEYWVSAEKDIQKGKELLKNALEVDPKFVKAVRDSALVSSMEGDSGEAERLFKQAIALDPSNVISHIYFARWYRQQGKLEQAEKALSNVIEQAPKDFRPHMELVNVLKEENRDGEALEHLKVATTLYPDSPPLKYQLITELIRQAKHDQALKEVNALLQQVPGDEGGLYLRSQILLAQDNPRDAIPDLQQVVRTHGNLIEVHTLLGMAYEKVEKFELAKREYEIVISKKSNSIDVKKRLIVLYQRLGQQTEAISLALALMEEDPNDAKVAEFLGTMLVQGQKHEKAIQPFSKAIELAPNNAMAYFKRGIAYVLHGNLDPGLKDLKKAVALEPKLLSRLIPVVVELDKAKPKQAVPFVRFITEQDTNKALGAFAKGLLAFNHQNPAEGERYLRQALEIDPQFLPSKMALAKWHFVNKNFGVALTLYQDAANMVPPENVLPRMGEGEVYLALREYDKAAQVYEGIVQTSPQTVVALNNLAWAYLKTNTNLDKALDLARKANQLAPETPSVLDTLGQLLIKHELFEEGIMVLTKLKDAAPNNPEIRVRMAQAYLESGKKESAEQEIQEGIEHVPKFAEREDVKELLKKFKVGRI